MRGKPKPRKGKGMLAWRSRQKTGAIMKPSTFLSIKEGEMERGLNEKRATKAAGAAYWAAAKAKYKERKK
jgi:hypothetical protein